MEEKFDRATEELAAERAKVTALLTDQRAQSDKLSHLEAPRSWWWR
jgi:hypothetical protein